MLREARKASRDTERHRQAMLAASERRRAAVIALHERGWTIRRIAAELGVSKAVVQGIIGKG